MKRIAIGLALGLGCAGTTLQAAGGGGGSSMPSQSAPSYDPASEYAKGIAALKAKDFKAAKTAFDRVLAAAPADANTNYLAGLSRTGLEDWKGSRRFLERAVKLDPELIGAQSELGVAHARSGDRSKAQAVLDTLNAKAASCAASCPKAAEIKAGVDAVTAAIAGMPSAVRANDSLLFASPAKGDNLYLVSVSLINEGRYEAAIASLEESRRNLGPHPDILTYLGFANRKLRRFEIAEGYYKAALAVAPGHRGATEYYGELKVERGDLAGARKLLARLDAQCQFGCAEAEELRRWIAAGQSPHS